MTRIQYTGTNYDELKAIPILSDDGQVNIELSHQLKVPNGIIFFLIPGVCPVVLDNDFLETIPNARDICNLLKESSVSLVILLPG